MALKVGFTGTSHTYSTPQVKTLYDLVAAHDISEWHHGDCIVADALSHNCAMDLRIKKIHIWPPIKSDKRAYCDRYYYPEGEIILHPEDSYLSRNRKIVEATDLLVGMPMQAEEQQYGGTWYTIRYATKKNKPITIILPDGALLHRNEAEER